MVGVKARGEPTDVDKETIVNYQPVSDVAQLQLLETLARMLLHGVLLVMVVASAVLLCLYLSELRLPQPRSPEVERPGGRRSSDPRLAARSRASLDHLTPIRLWAEGAEGRAPFEGGPGAADRSGGGRPSESSSALWFHSSEPASEWGKPAQAR